jgi:manganese efflux pump family protein
MVTFLKMIVLVLSLGIDTLLISTSLGALKTKGKLKIAIVFACTEAVMPLIGLFIGKEAGGIVGNWTSLIGGILLLGVAVWLLFFEDKDEEEEEKLERNLVGWTLIMTAISISLDELAVGFSIGLVGVPIVLTIFLISLQAFVFTYLGLSFGSKLKPFLGEWSEKVAGVVLGLLGVWIIIEAVLKL